MNIAVLISGRGSNMLALNEAIKQQRLTGVEISLVISSRADAKGLVKARQQGLPTEVVDRSEFNSRQDFELKLRQAIQRQPIDLIVLAGFMHILSADFISHFTDKIINIHPSLLPKYKGLNTHQYALADGESHHGLTIHVVTKDLDSGATILQKTIPVPADATADRLADIVLQQEHRFLPLVVQLLADNKIALRDSSVWFNGCQLHRRGIQWDQEDLADMAIRYKDSLVGGYSASPTMASIVSDGDKSITEEENRQVEAIHHLLSDSKRWLLEQDSNLRPIG